VSGEVEVEPAAIAEAAAVADVPEVDEPSV
jgi:hypothetical protein